MTADQLRAALEVSEALRVKLLTENAALKAQIRAAAAHVAALPRAPSSQRIP